MHIVLGILFESWKIMQASAIYLLFGFLMAGILYVLVPAEKIVKYLGGKGVKPVLLAALFGVPIPLCSCGVLPAGISLRKQGASKGAAMAFMIATPETGIDSIALTYALIDPIMTIFRPIAAFVTAVVAGIANNWISKHEHTIEEKESGTSGKSEPEVCTDECCRPVIETSKPIESGFVKKLGIGIRYAFIDLMGDTAKWFVLGILLAGVITYFVPTTWVHNYLGNTFTAMVAMLAIGIPLYVCASCSTPITAALILKGISPGAAFVFLLTGPATNAAAIPLITRYFGKKSMLIYLISIAGCAVIFGLILNAVYSWLGITPTAIVGKAAKIFPESVTFASAILLAILLIYSWFRQKTVSRKQ